MANGKDASASSVKSTNEKPTLPFRQFKDRPTAVFVDSIMRQVRETARPELIEDLFRNPIPKDVEFFIIRPDVVIDRKKRPDGDLAPCPMCSPNKFLRGSLIYIPSMQCCAIIGHCCAGRERRAAAAREYTWRTKRDYEENYLLNNLALVPARMKVLQEMGPVCSEARRLYRQFRKDCPEIQHQLRHVRRNYGGHLILTEIIRGGEDDEIDDYVGPAGFKGRSSDIETREHDFGILAGETATVKNYDPVQDLNTLVRQLGSIDTVKDETEVVEFICGITEKQRTAAVAIMEAVDHGTGRLVSKLRDFVSFFTRENAEALNAWGTSNLNPMTFAAEFTLIRRLPTLVITYDWRKHVFTVGRQLHNFRFIWPTPL